MATISELLSDIRKRDLVLPEFQREYVWSRDQAKQLMVSLLKGYPVGGLLFWKTDQPPDLKNIDKLPEKLGTVSVILDGQQRLTTLYMLITGDIPTYYTRAEIENDPRDLFFNIGDGEFQYYQASRMKDNPLWRRVIECFDGNEINVFEIAKKNAGSDAEAFALAQKYNDQLTRLRQIKAMDLPVQVVPSHATLDEAIDIFDRVNSLGTKLTDAELALTHITGKWPTARREIKAKIASLARHNFEFDLNFMTRALTGVVVQRALFETIHQTPRADLQAGWERLRKILDYLVGVLAQGAFIHSTRDLNTTNVLIPWVVYLARQDGRFPDNKALKRAIHWLYAAQTWARYTSQTDQRLEHDVLLVVKEESPWQALCEQIIDQRGRIEVKGSDLEGRGVPHPLFRMLYVLAKAHGAVDWFNGMPLGTTVGKAYQIHAHHIFPQSVLYKNGFDPENHLDRTVVNEIANRAWLTADTNLDISNRLPEQYLPEVQERFPGALEHQFVPLNPDLWKVAAFREFLDARRELMARKLNEFMAALIGEPEPTRRRPVQELIALGESSNLEFKTTLQWDVVQRQINKGLRLSVLKTIAAFMNSDGGTLIIGVEDNGAVYGLDDDLNTVQQSTDKYLQLLFALIAENMGPQYSALVKVRIEPINGKQVCVVDVDKAPEAVFVAGQRGKEFYIRVGNTTRALDPEQAVSYIDNNWS